MAGGSWDFEDEGYETDKRDAIPTASQPRHAMTELVRFALGTSDVNGSEGEDGYNADLDEEDAASQIDAGSMQNVEATGHSRFD